MCSMITRCQGPTTSKVSASQTLMSGRCIFFVQDLRDTRAAQLHAAGLTRPDERNPNSPLLDGLLRTDGLEARNGDVRSFGERRPIFQKHYTVVHAAAN